MKQTFTFLFLFFAMLGLNPEAGLAQDIQRQGYNQARLSVSNYNNYALRVIVDGNTYDKGANDDDLVLSNLNAGNHNVKIYRLPARGRKGAYGSNAIRVIYDANVYLRSQYQTDILINRFGHIFKDEALISDYDNPNQPSNPQYPQYNREMSAESFTALKTTINNDPYDNSKFNLVKQAAAGNYFTAIQVKQLMQLFSYENTKLDVAKALYPRTVDKANYFMVNDAFTYSNSKDRLAEFIRDNP